MQSTAIGEHFVREGRSVIKKMLATRRQCQQLANGWRGQLRFQLTHGIADSRRHPMQLLRRGAEAATARHRIHHLTPAGEHFVREGRSVIKKMLATRRQCQQLANGWR
jgi:DNA-binding transcriptional LysR family regulator